MLHFTITKLTNLLGTIIFVLLGIFLITAFSLNLSTLAELQQISNFDNWKFFILLSGVLALLLAVVFAFGFWKVSRRLEMFTILSPRSLCWGEGV